jgi:hypothetical protein
MSFQYPDDDAARQVQYQTETASDLNETQAPGLREALWIWGVIGVLTLAVFTTYARFPVSEFYNVSIDGLAGGLSRALVLSNFPIAFMAIALMGIAVARLFAVPGAPGRYERWLVGGLALVATVMSLMTALVVTQSNLDAKPGNAIPAVGVLIAFGLTVFAVWRTGTGPRRDWSRGDSLRAITIAVLAFIALPWILADLGVLIGDIPVIGSIFMSKEVVAGESLVAVHLGHHHGLDGALFAIFAIILIRPLGQVRGRLRWPLTIYVAFMLVYGVTNMVQDFWGEQLVKRGTTTTEFPSMILPKLTLAWGLAVIATALVAIALHWYFNREQRAVRAPLNTFAPLPEGDD